MTAALKVSPKRMAPSFKAVAVPLSTETEWSIRGYDQDPTRWYHNIDRLEPYMNDLDAYIKKLWLWLRVFSTIALLALIAAGYLYFIANRVEYLALLTVFFGTFGNAVVLVMKISKAMKLTDVGSDQFVWNRPSSGPCEPSIYEIDPQAIFASSFAFARQTRQQSNHQPVI